MSCDGLIRFEPHGQLGGVGFHRLRLDHGRGGVGNHFKMGYQRKILRQFDLQHRIGVLDVAFPAGEFPTFGRISLEFDFIPKTVFVFLRSLVDVTLSFDLHRNRNHRRGRGRRRRRRGCRGIGKQFEPRGHLGVLCEYEARYAFVTLGIAFPSDEFPTRGRYGLQFNRVTPTVGLPLWKDLDFTLSFHNGCQRYQRWKRTIRGFCRRQAQHRFIFGAVTGDNPDAVAGGGFQAGNHAFVFT